MRIEKSPDSGEQRGLQMPLHDRKDSHKILHGFRWRIADKIQTICTRSVSDKDSICILRKSSRTLLGNHKGFYRDAMLHTTGFLRRMQSGFYVDDFENACKNLLTGFVQNDVCIRNG